MIRFQQDARKATFTAQTTTTVDEISCMFNQDPRQRGGGGRVVMVIIIIMIIIREVKPPFLKNEICQF